MLFNLIYNNKILLCIKRDTIEEVIKYTKEQIFNDDNVEWKHLKDIDPSKCKIRTDRIVHTYYDLEGNLMEKDKII